jgi:hypothetical protein
LCLELIGHLDNYKTVFDLEKYRRNRSTYIGHILAAGFKNGQPNDRDAILLLIEKYDLRLLLNGFFLKLFEMAPTRSVQIYGKFVGYCLDFRDRATWRAWPRFKQFFRSKTEMAK